LIRIQKIDDMLALEGFTAPIIMPRS